MEHPDPADLADLALGHPVPRSLRAHVAGCALCRDEVAALYGVAEAARAASAEDRLTPPPDAVWRAIAAELAAGSPGQGSGGEPGADAASAYATDRPGPEMPPVRGDRRGGRAPVPPPRRTKAALLLAAGCLAVGAALGSGATWWHLDDPAVVAVRPGRESPLAPLAVADARGTARLDSTPGGGRTLRIDVSGLPRSQGYFEVWLMDSSHQKLIAVGVLGPEGSTTLPLPPGVDLADYPVIDVSDQPYDGDPAHSGRSVVRGPLRS
ncbi:anti-sigma factor [Streptomyces indicus]|uniref:Anti-sigma-K factor RskA n=1 Tax=Streptomyces indicus TaxID=417292 RepID=A0A1G8TTW5_9ACTN|nr:anti-sigma factor [Streptomyces indicus]SDJ44877.1 Anti-sigma-K factor RskA [Streptomyces indicus]